MSRGTRSSGPLAESTTMRAGIAGAPAVGKRTLVEDLATELGAVQRKVGDRPGEEPGAVKAAAAHGTSGAGVALPHRDAIQRAFGRHDIRGIRAHIGGRASEGAAQLGAEAYASGEQIAFATPPSLHTAAHEAAHVVQQRAGVALAGGVGQRGDGYEQRADAVADRVVQGQSAEDLLGGVAPAGGGTPAVQRKVQVDKIERAFETLGEIAKPGREQQVLRDMVEADPTYDFATEEELGGFVANVARTDWGESTVGDEIEQPGERVATFARSQVGKHIWASDNRMRNELRVTRTNTLNKQFLDQKQKSGLPGQSHNVLETLGSNKHIKQHVYSAMMTSLSPAARDEERRKANDDVKPRPDVEGEQRHPGSVMNCEQFVAYSLWGGGVIRDWELALIFAACAQEARMDFLYQAMGLDAANPVVPVPGREPEPNVPEHDVPEHEQAMSLGLNEVSVLFEIKGNERSAGQVAHMLLYVGGGQVIELNASKTDPERWKASQYPETTYLERKFEGKTIFACPVIAIPAKLTDTLTAIATQYPGGKLLAPKQIQGEVTPQHRRFGFLDFEQV